MTDAAVVEIRDFVIRKRIITSVYKVRDSTAASPGGHLGDQVLMNVMRKDGVELV